MQWRKAHQLINFSFESITNFKCLCNVWHLKMTHQISSKLIILKWLFIHNPLEMFKRNLQKIISQMQYFFCGGHYKITHCHVKNHLNPQQLHSSYVGSCRNLTHITNRDRRRRIIIKNWWRRKSQQKSTQHDYKLSSLPLIWLHAIYFLLFLPFFICEREW